jgi:hypothetical protein
MAHRQWTVAFHLPQHFQHPFGTPKSPGAKHTKADPACGALYGWPLPIARLPSGPEVLISAGEDRPAARPPEAVPTRPPSARTGLADAWEGLRGPAFERIQHRFCAVLWRSMI